MKIKKLCVFCGASDAVEPHFLEHGKQFGKMMAERNIRLVYGGGDCGMMGAVANSVMKAGGEVTGVFPKFLNEYESEHTSLTEMIMVEDMHTRKWKMFEESDGIAVLPGGFGTLDESFEVITWKQLGRHEKPIIINNYQGYWNALVSLKEHIIENGFAKPETRDLYKVVDSLEEVFEALEAHA